ncbi:MAG: hypothetical protein IH891_03185 [Planctomycetes bacterium]|nr:hypothetical protein [Planctomycetota bacterium]
MSTSTAIRLGIVLLMAGPLGCATVGLEAPRYEVLWSQPVMEKTAQQTIDLHHELDPGDFGYFVFYPYPGTHLFQECRRLGYLPENYLELPANHRESILDLPEMTKEDITCMYDRWTQIRIRHQLKRIGSENAPKHRDLITTEIEQCAAAG